MRATEVPKILFYKIAKTLKAKVRSYDMDGDQAVSLAFSKREQATIGFLQCRLDEGIYSYFNAWNYFPESNLELDHFCKNLYMCPPFQIIAGPIEGENSDPELGIDFTENIVVHFANNNPKGATFFLDNNFFDFLDYILGTAKLIQIEVKPKKHRYWGRFVGQKINYLDP